jgi:hypothetical protein
LLSLSGIGLFVAFAQIVLSVVLAHHPIGLRILFLGLSGLLLLACACVVLREASALWQIPLQACAMALIAAGATTLITSAVYNWQAFLGSVGIKSALSLITGLAAGGLMRRLQVRLLPKQDA